MLAVLAGAARAQGVVKIGLVQSMTGPFNTESNVELAAFEAMKGPLKVAKK